MNNLLRVGTIGYRNHAARLIAILEARSDVVIERIFHPNKDLGLRNSTMRFEDLLDCDAIFIASPNETHCDYLRRVEPFSGYVFCEKPPVTQEAELQHLRNDPNRTFFNFNMRFSQFSQVAHDYLCDGRLGDIVFADAVTCHGLAFKPTYKGSWRSDRTKHKLGIIETVCIHYIDFFISLFGAATSQTVAAHVTLKEAGTAFDTSRVMITFENGCIGSVTSSYTTPYIDNISLIGTEGILIMENDIIVLKGPRDCFDENEFFLPPPVIETITPPAIGAYQDSLERSVSYFVDRAKAGEPFERRDFLTSLSTMKCLFALENNLV